MTPLGDEPDQLSAYSLGEGVGQGRDPVSRFMAPEGRLPGGHRLGGGHGQRHGLEPEPRIEAAAQPFQAEADEVGDPIGAALGAGQAQIEAAVEAIHPVQGEAQGEGPEAGPFQPGGDLLHQGSRRGDHIGLAPDRIEEALRRRESLALLQGSQGLRAAAMGLIQAHQGRQPEPAAKSRAGQGFDVPHRAQTEAPQSLGRSGFQTKGLHRQACEGTRRPARGKENPVRSSMPRQGEGASGGVGQGNPGWDLRGSEPSG